MSYYPDAGWTYDDVSYAVPRICECNRYTAYVCVRAWACVRARAVVLVYERHVRYRHGGSSFVARTLCSLRPDWKIVAIHFIW